MTSDSPLPRSFVRALGAFVDASVSPSTCFEGIRSGSIPAVQIVVVALLCTLLSQLPGLQAFDAMKESIGEKGLAIPDWAHTLFVVGILFTPIIMLAKILGVGYLLWAGTVFVRPSADLRSDRFIALAAAVQCVTVLHFCVTALILKITGNYLHPSSAEIGLNLLSPVPGWDAFLSFVNPFTIWYAALMFFGMQRVASLNREEALYSLAPYLVLTSLIVFIQLYFARATAT